MPRDTKRSARSKKNSELRDAGAASVAEAPSLSRHAMIAEAAYYRALERGFEGGDPLEDWYSAEREIDGLTVHDLRPKT